MCFFSIITVVKNRQDSIENTLSSVRYQTFKDFEYIVIDGNSTDHTIEILKDNSDIINLFMSEDDKSVYDALNKGINLSKGRYICFLHSDDHYNSENVLSKIHNEIISSKLDVLFASAAYYKIGEYTKQTRIYSASKFNEKLINYGFMPPHTSMFARKEIYSKVGLFNTNFKIASDADWLLRMYNLDNLRIKYIEDEIINMNVGGISYSSFFNLSKVFRIHNELSKVFKLNNRDTNWFKLFLRFKYKYSQLKKL